MTKEKAEQIASDVWDKLDKFSGYGFNKCLSGKEIIHRIGINKGCFNPTIEEMFLIKNDYEYAKFHGHLDLRKKYISKGYGMCFSLSEDGRLKKNNIVDIRYEGRRKTYEVKTKSGKKICCTLNHKFPTERGELPLFRIKIGDRIPINLGYEENTSKWNLTKNWTNNYPSTVQQGFQTVDRPDSIIFNSYRKRKQQEGAVCEKCGKLHRRMEAHHVDGDHTNNDEENYAWLCPGCHKKEHYKDHNRIKMGEKGLLCEYEEIISIKSNCVEKVYDVEVSRDISHTFLTTDGIVTCNSHAAAYTVMSYWSQWFKVNHPLEFWTTSLQYSSESEIPYRLSEIKKEGTDIEIRPPDVNFSDGNFTCDPKNNRIFFSLTKIKGVGQVAVDNIMETRTKGGKFFSAEEFISRVPSKVNKSVIVKLIISGSFDLIEDLKIPRDRKKLLRWFLEDQRHEELPEKYNSKDSETNAFWIFEQKDLTGFGEVDYETMIQESIPNKRVRGMYISGGDFFNVKENTEVTIVGKLIYYMPREIKNGTMMNMTIDSNNSIIDVIIWPDVWESIKEEPEDLKNKVIAINGRSKKDSFRGKRVLYSDKGTKLYIVS